MYTGLKRLIVTQIQDYISGSLSLDALSDYLAPMLWESDRLDDEPAEDLMFSVELFISEYQAGHLNESELRDELISLCAYEEVSTASGNRHLELSIVA